MVNFNTSVGSSSRAVEDYSNSLDQVIGKHPDVGSIMGSNLIFGFDFTKSNEETGASSLRGHCLHKIEPEPLQNPYEQAIAASGKALSTFQADDCIPCFGFGDGTTTDRKVFSFNPYERPCRGHKEALNRYKEIAPQLQLSGPTSFAPLIETALDIVERSGRKYHILLIFTSGRQVGSRMANEPESSNLSPQEQKMIDAIRRARKYPLSIIFVGVGEGPCNLMMNKFRDNIPHLEENFHYVQFVDFTKIMSKKMPLPGQAQEFQIATLMELFSQHKAMSERNIIGRGCVPLPPPRGSTLSVDTSFANYAWTYNKVTRSLGEAGIEEASLIVGIDFTKANNWTGRKSYGVQSLHHDDAHCQNPYEQVLRIFGSEFSTLQTVNPIPCFGFGDEGTTDQKVFSFNLDERPCKGYEEALKRYREIAQHVELAGPRSLSAIIDMAIDIVERSGREYHVLLIIACGQVSSRMPNEPESSNLSPQEEKTIDAIRRAREYPLSIIFVGVGDGPWNMMMNIFRKNIPHLEENFHFVDSTEIMSKQMPLSDRIEEFARAALMKLRSQRTAMWNHGVIGCPRRVLPPPPSSYGVNPCSAKQVCVICFDNPKNMAFGCGHQTCCDCGHKIANCPICRSEITLRIKLYD